jgi:beta-glucosidase
MKEAFLTSETRFPAGFVWGSATAAYQIEGAAAEDGRTPSIWDVFSHTPGRTLHGDTGDVACDHYHRLGADLDLIASLGLRAHRWSVSWSRVKPSADGTTNAAGLDFYERVVDGLLERGVDPVGTLYHWDMPQWLQDKGGWAARDTAEYFGDFAEAVLERVGDRVPRWITVNEPYCSSFIGHLEGRHAPGLTDEATAVATAHHLLLAHARALARIRALAPDAKAAITLNLSDVHPAGDSDEDRAAAARVDLVENRMFLSPLFKGGYPEDAGEFYAGITDFGFVRDGDLEAIGAPQDFIGVNFYEQHRVAADPAHVRDIGNIVRGARKLDPEPPVTAGNVAIRPEALYNLLTRVHREWTDLPVWVTENGLAANDYADPEGRCHDPERIDYLAGHFRAAARAIEDGVPLEAYLVWSLMDNFEWAEGYGKRFGLVYVDYPTQTRIPKSSARWFSRVIAANAVPAS